MVLVCGSSGFWSWGEFELPVSRGDRPGTGEEFRERAEGLRGTEGEAREVGDMRAGEDGRLMEYVSLVRTEVLDMRVPESVGKMGKALGVIPFGTMASSIRALLWVLEPVLPVPPVAAGGMFKPCSSSSSSMDGNCCWKVSRLKCDSRGDEVVEDVGEGGPRVEAGTKA